jgi:hypothetical protein
VCHLTENMRVAVCHAGTHLLMAAKELKPVLTGQRIKARKRGT